MCVFFFMKGTQLLITLSSCNLNRTNLFISMTWHHKKVHKKFKANMENGTAIFQFPIDDMIA